MCILCADLSESGLALKDFPLALKESLHAKKANIKQKCASISCQSHIFETFSILHAIDFWYPPRLPRERLLRLTPGCWKSSNLNTKNAKWNRTPPPLAPPRKIPESFPVKHWKTSRGFQPSRIHNRWKVTLAQNGRHFFQLLHKQVGKASPPLSGVSQAIDFWSRSTIDSCVSVSHNWLFNFFSYSFLPLKLSPSSCLPSSTPWRLALSQVVLIPLTTQSRGWTTFLCACVAFFSSQTRSSPVLEADGIDQPPCH